MPRTVPVDEIVAMAVFPLFQVPPVVASLSVVVAPVQTVAVPVIAVSEKPVFQPHINIPIKYIIFFTFL